MTVAGRLDSSTASHVETLLPTAGWPFNTPFVSPEASTSDLKIARHAAAAPWFVVLATALFAVYLLAVRLASCLGSGAARNLALAFALLFQVLALLSPRMLSTDLYSYVFYGRILGVYHGNPYLEVPAQYPGDPFYDEVFWKFVPSFYGPLWMLICAPLARLAGEDPGLAALLFRGLASGCAVLSSAVIARLLAGAAPQAAVAGLVMFGWSPLVVIEAGLSGHNDLLMVTLVLLAIALLVARRPIPAVGAMLLAGLVKLVALALLPLLGLFVLRQLESWRARARFLLGASVLGALLAGLVVGPVWAGSATFEVGTLGVGSDRYTNGLGELALGELRVLLGETRRDTEVPLQFRGWWVATHRATVLRADPDERADALVELPQWTDLLVVGPERNGWSRVWDPGSRGIGYLESSALGPSERPSGLESDEEALARERGPEGSSTLQTANTIVRLAGWVGVAVVCLGALVRGTTSIGGLLRGWTAVWLALLYLASAWFWPWYVIWALATAALIPFSLLSRLTVLLTWGVLLLYAGLGFGESNLWYLQTYRSLFVFGLPLAIFLLDSAIRWSFPGDRPVAQPSRQRSEGDRPVAPTA